MKAINHINLHLSVSIFPEDGVWIAYAPTLELATSADTEKEVRQRFVELLEIFFTELARSGNTEKVLSSCGWKKDGSEWREPIQKGKTAKLFQVPIEV